MAEPKKDQPSEEAVQATSEQYAGASGAVPSELGTEARNPVDLGTDLDQLPPVPGAGQFMSSEDATEPTAPTAADGGESSRSAKKG